MFRGILASALVLALIWLGLQGLGWLMASLLGRDLSTLEWTLAVLVLAALAAGTLLRRRKQARRKHLALRDSALW
ncbi:hypothetical protein [Variovorax terrae]|uniref:Uncharacterized protein n=1 Tax=Variovorax terrae TaxID=2923278 RepID=A0A9X1VUK4_9BURK|nr:hypothetical protein [Variovorax terrae]MCJ0762137.1 hypothetical protein [Variovorax terrae]